jgi:hypothetical protein
MKKRSFPPMPPDPYHREDKKGESCRLAVALGLVSLHPDSPIYIGNYNFHYVVAGKPVYFLKNAPDPNNNKGEEEECEAWAKQARATGRIY